MRRPLIQRLFLVLLLVVSSAACDELTVQPELEPVVLVHLYSDLIDIEEPQQIAASLAERRINAAGGLLGGRPLQIRRIIVEAGGNGEAVRQTFDEYNAAGVVGPFAEGTLTYDAQRVAFETQTLQITNLTSIDSLYRAHPDDDRFLYFMGPPSSEAGWPGFVEEWADRGCTDIGIVAPSITVGIIDPILVELTAAEGMALTMYPRSTAVGDPDFVTEVRDAGHDCIGPMYGPPNALTFLEVWFEDPPEVPVQFMARGDLASPEFTEGIAARGLDLTGMILMIETLVPPSRLEYQELRLDVLATTGEELEDIAASRVALLYDMTVMLALAVERAGVPRGAALRNAFVENSRQGSGSQAVGPLEVSRALSLVRNGQPIDYQGARDDLDFGSNGYPNTRVSLVEYMGTDQEWVFVGLL